MRKAGIPWLSMVVFFFFVNPFLLTPSLADFSDSGQTMGNAESWEVAPGDLDGDGDPDAFIANGDGANTVWFNDGSGIFSNSSWTTGGSCSRTSSSCSSN